MCAQKVNISTKISINNKELVANKFQIILCKEVVGVRKCKSKRSNQLHCSHRKEGNVLFNDALNTFSYCYMASDIW